MQRLPLLPAFNSIKMNYFELFDMPVSLSPDPRLLMERYLLLQKKYHPDFFTQADDESREHALQMSSTINKAIKTLRNPDALLAYVLGLKGIITPDEKYNLPPDFLMEVMELNEELNEQTPAAVARLEAEIYAPVAKWINQYQHQTIPDAALLELKDYYYKKKYLQRILDRING
jgi:molecular chaperone HscB